MTSGVNNSDELRQTSLLSAGEEQKGASLPSRVARAVSGFFRSGLTLFVDALCYLKYRVRIADLQQAHSLVTSQFSIQDRFLLIKTIENVPVEERADVINQAQMLIVACHREHRDADQCMAIFTAVAAVSKENRASVIGQVHGLVSSSVINYSKVPYWVDIIAAAANSISVEGERAGFIDWVGSAIVPRFNNNEIEKRDLINIIKEISAVVATERDSVMELALQFHKGKRDLSWCAEVIGWLKTIPNAKREACVKGALQHITDSMSMLYRIDILKAMAKAKILVEQIEQCATWALQLLPSNPSYNDSINIFNALARVESSNVRRKCVRGANLLINPEMDSSGRIQIIGALAAVPVKEMASVIDHVLPDPSADMSVADLVENIHIAAAVPEEKRAVFVEWMEKKVRSQLCTQDVDAFDRHRIIKAVGNLFVQMPDDEEKRDQIVQALAAVPAKIRDLCVECAQKLLTKEMTAAACVKIINTVKTISILTRNYDAGARLATIVADKNLCAEESVDVFERAASFVVGIELLDYEWLVNEIVDLPKDTRGACIEDAKRQITYEDLRSMNSYQRLKVLADVCSSCRKDVKG